MKENIPLLTHLSGDETNDLSIFSFVASPKISVCFSHLVLKIHTLWIRTLIVTYFKKQILIVLGEGKAEVELTNRII